METRCFYQFKIREADNLELCKICKINHLPIFKLVTKIVYENKNKQLFRF